MEKLNVKNFMTGFFYSWAIIFLVFVFHDIFHRVFRSNEVLANVSFPILVVIFMIVGMAIKRNKAFMWGSSLGALSPILFFSLLALISNFLN